MSGEYRLNSEGLFLLNPEGIFDLCGVCCADIAACLRSGNCCYGENTVFTITLGTIDIASCYEDFSDCVKPGFSHLSSITITWPSITLVNNTAAAVINGGSAICYSEDIWQDNLIKYSTIQFVGNQELLIYVSYNGAVWTVEVETTINSLKYRYTASWESAADCGGSAEATIDLSTVPEEGSPVQDTGTGTLTVSVQGNTCCNSEGFAVQNNPVESASCNENGLNVCDYFDKLSNLVSAKTLVFSWNEDSLSAIDEAGEEYFLSYDAGPLGGGGVITNEKWQYQVQFDMDNCCGDNVTNGRITLNTPTCYFEEEPITVALTIGEIKCCQCTGECVQTTSIPSCHPDTRELDCDGATPCYDPAICVCEEVDKSECPVCETAPCTPETYTVTVAGFETPEIGTCYNSASLAFKREGAWNVNGSHTLVRDSCDPSWNKSIGTATRHEWTSLAYNVNDETTWASTYCDANNTSPPVESGVVYSRTDTDSVINLTIHSTQYSVGWSMSDVYARFGTSVSFGEAFQNGDTFAITWTLIDFGFVDNAECKKVADKCFNSASTLTLIWDQFQINCDIVSSDISVSWADIDVGYTGSVNNVSNSGTAVLQKTGPNTWSLETVTVVSTEITETRVVTYYTDEYFAYFTITWTDGTVTHTRTSYTSLYGDYCCDTAYEFYESIYDDGNFVTSVYATINKTVLDCGRIDLVQNVNGGTCSDIPVISDGFWSKSESLNGGTRTVNVTYGEDGWVCVIIWTDGVETVYLTATFNGTEDCTNINNVYATLEFEGSEESFTQYTQLTHQLVNNDCCLCGTVCKQSPVTLCSSCENCQSCLEMPITGTVNFTYPTLSTVQGGLTYTFEPPDKLTITSNACTLVLNGASNCCGEMSAIVASERGITTATLNIVYNGGSTCCSNKCTRTVDMPSGWFTSNATVRISPCS
jgi:hypothetical protein